MNVLDVAENSVAAGATLVAITLSIDTAAKRMTLTITDNGKGMPPEMAARVTDPFCTTRKTRKVGLGLPFLKMAAEMTGGALSIESTVGKGTCVTAWFTLGHIDLAPLGDMSATVAGLKKRRMLCDTETFGFNARRKSTNASAMKGSSNVFVTQPCQQQTAAPLAHASRMNSIA